MLRADKLLLLLLLEVGIPANRVPAELLCCHHVIASVTHQSPQGLHALVLLQ